MFPDTNLLFLFAPAMILVCILLLVRKNQHERIKNELSKAIANFKATSMAFGFLLFVLLLLLPHTPALSTFDHPKSFSVVKDEAKLLQLLQTYNKALIRTTQVLYWFLFLFVVFFLTSLYGIAKAYRKSNQQNVAQ